MMNSKKRDWTMAAYKFDRYFGAVNACQKWADEVLRRSAIKRNGHFEELALEALESLAKREQVKLIDDEKQAFMHLFKLVSAEQLLEIQTDLKKSA